MVLRSPFEDLVSNTLAEIPGLLKRLDYLASLRDRDGVYSHWGLARVYGEASTQQAAAEAHRLLFSRVLSTPLGELIEELAKSATSQDPVGATYLDSLTERIPSLLPKDAGRAPMLHFNSVLHALSALAQNRKQGRQQAS